MSIKIISIILVLIIASPLFFQTAQAAVLDSTIGFSSCAAGGFISNQITQGLGQLEKFVTEKIKNWLIRNRAIPIPGIPLPINLGTGGKVPVIDDDVKNAVDDYKGIYVAKEGAQDIVARCAARELLTAMGQNINNVARTGGRNGGPSWVRNWRNFQLDAQHRGEGVFRGVLASTKVCNYFGNELKDLFGANQKIDLSKIQVRINDFDPFALKTACTMPNGFNFDQYKQNFSSNGGWQAWSRLLEPQNNFYGALFQSLDEANKQRALEESADLNEAKPTGFTSTRGRNSIENCAVKSPADGRCLIYNDILTPGSILSGAVIGGIESELQWVASTDEMSELIATAINVLVNRLWDLSNPNEGDYIVPGEPETSAELFPPPIPEPPSTTCNAITPAEGASARYISETQTAVNEFLTANPNIANSPNSDPIAVGEFLEGVATILNAQGFVSGRVLNCNNNIGSDAIIVGSTGDIYGDYLDLIFSIGSGDTISNSVQVTFTEWAGMERIISGGGVPGGGPFNPIP